MKTIILSALITILAISIYGQNNHLVLKKINRNKQKVIQTSTKIKVITKSGYVVKGKLINATENAIIVESDTIQIKDIQKIRNKSIAGIITGSVVGATGTLGIIGGTGIIISTSSEGALAAIVGVIIGVPVIAGGIIVTSTGILIATIGKAYKAKKWEYMPLTKN